MKDKMFSGIMRICALSYVAQAISVSLPPLFFVTLSVRYGWRNERLGFLVFCGFAAQMCADISAEFICERIGERKACVLASGLCVCGLVMLGAFPALLSDYLCFYGILISVIIAQCGGGLIEVLVNPIVDSVPFNGRNSRCKISFARAFYCFGNASVVFLTALGMRFIDLPWNIYPVLWSVFPTLSIVGFLFVRLPEPRAERIELMSGTEKPHYVKISSGTVLMPVMIAAGAAAEQGMAQWIPAYAEVSLGLGSFICDLVGPCAFALLMGISRLIFGVCGDRLPINRVAASCGAVCLFCYLAAAFGVSDYASVAACGLSGAASGLMCPVIYGLAAERLPEDGARLFGRLALFGDIGCSLGPWIVGAFSGGGSFRTGFFAAAAFPAVYFASCLILFSGKASRR